MSLQANQRYDPLSEFRPAPLIHPLSSQPLIELSLRIPTYVLRTGGRDRAIARRAFERDLPAEIIRRRTKASSDESFQSALNKQIDGVRELLMGGFLVQHGYLQREPLEEALTPERPTRLKVPPLTWLECLALEIWCRSWASASRRAAA